MKTYTVTLPITGYAILSVEAENEDEAIDNAIELVDINHIDEWKAVALNAEAVCEDDDEDEEDGDANQ